MRVFPQELLIRKLKGKELNGARLDWLRQMSKDECLEELRAYAGKDLGSDPAVWEAWWEDEKKRLDIDPEF